MVVVVGVGVELRAEEHGGGEGGGVGEHPMALASTNAKAAVIG